MPDGRVFIFNSLPALDKDEAEIFLINCHPPLIVTKMPHLVDRLVVALSVVSLVVALSVVSLVVALSVT